MSGTTVLVIDASDTAKRFFGEISGGGVDFVVTRSAEDAGGGLDLDRVSAVLVASPVQDRPANAGEGFGRNYLVCDSLATVADVLGPVAGAGASAEPNMVTYRWDVFRDFLKKEVHKTLRYERKLALVGIAIADAAVIIERVGKSEYERTLLEISNALHGVIRDSDWLIRKSDDRFIVYLTETDYFGALMAIRRVRKALAGKTMVRSGDTVEELPISLASVALRIHGTTLDELASELEARLAESRKSLPSDIDFDRLRFSELCAKLMVNAIVEPSGDAWLSQREPGVINAESLPLCLADSRSNPKRRGVIFCGFLSHAETQAFAGHSADSATKVYLFLSDAKKEDTVPGVISVGALGSESGILPKFLLYLNEHYAYACVEYNGRCFETSDEPLVDALINKLQTEFFLQWQF